MSTSGAPPPPPPKPPGHISSADPSRSGTPLSQSQAQPAPPPPLPPNPTQSTPQQALPTQQHQQIPPPSHQNHWLPTTPSGASLASHTITDLHKLASSPAQLSALATSHPSYASSLAPLSQLLTQNLAAAQQLQSLESQLSHLRQQTAQLLLNHTSLQTQWRRKQGEMDDALSPWQPRAMYQRLVASITEQEALLRAMMESFLDGGGEDRFYDNGDGKASDKEVTEWIRRIREGATTLEKRREMRARWDEGRVGGWR
ncbi:uncharacterized protein HMPREF1541_00129 [Cyphellophora europaea CBS 101466]|uniref:VPS37 C-terminal domain-containing protein n=1 Tax=Cyphellophora europaea (strain CBS 101466) TaxID=1220924 RepID=W2SB77_CYPE1|nr:uncharacterized protein HMPREF1541_00129 [Cyphellophora europaea CBS 101466]ETN45947.1 hypothetical protein HMPREF1541_00129 [Cyphellophora europaea CBS 101466]